MAARADAISIGVGTRFGRHEIVARRCSGGMADVWIAIPIAPAAGEDGAEAPSRVAIKTLLPQLAVLPDHVERFAQEAALHAGFRHPNVVRCLETGSDGGVPWIALEYVNGVTLRELIEATRPRRVPLGVALQLGARVCDALEYVHDFRGADGPLGLVHCDVSPENVMIAFDGEVKLIDFGLATATRGRAALPPPPVLPDTSLIAIRTDRHLGRIQYMAPERVQGVGLDARSDVYSVGVILFELIYGARPFAADGMYELLGQICSGTTIARDDAIDAEVAAIVARAMAPDPQARTPTAGELGAALSIACARIGAASESTSRYVGRVVGADATTDVEAEVESSWSAGAPESVRPPPNDPGPKDTLRPGAGTELYEQLQALLRATREHEARPQLLDRETSPTPIVTIDVTAAAARASVPRVTSSDAEASAPPATPRSPVAPAAAASPSSSSAPSSPAPSTSSSASSAPSWPAPASSAPAPPPRVSDVFARPARSAPPMPDVFGAFSRKPMPARLPSWRAPSFGGASTASTAAATAAAPRSFAPASGPRAQAAAHFERGWTALRDGDPAAALAAWETALALDPDNRTYAVNVRQLRKKMDG